MLHSLILLFLSISPVLSNTEKLIILGPKKVDQVYEQTKFNHVDVKVLSPQNPHFRTYIESEFPTNSSKFGRSSWFWLDDLIEDQKYEVRICWAATQPTTFRLETHNLHRENVIPNLISEMVENDDVGKSDPEVMFLHTTYAASKALVDERKSSAILLQVNAAAEYFTWNRDLMQEVPLVHVEIIVDPYLLHIFPVSLLPTLVYLTILFVGSYVSANLVVKLLEDISRKSIKSKKHS